jgi:hypothetical protein
MSFKGGNYLTVESARVDPQSRFSTRLTETLPQSPTSDSNPASCCERQPYFPTESQFPREGQNIVYMVDSQYLWQNHVNLITLCIPR